MHGLNIVTILLRVLDRSKVQEVLEYLLCFLGPESASKFVKNAVQSELRDDGIINFTLYHHFHSFLYYFIVYKYRKGPEFVHFVMLIDVQAKTSNIFDL